MDYTRESALAKLLESYSAYFNVYKQEETGKPLVAVCEFFQTSENYVLSRKAQLWQTNCEEFVYLFDVEHLTPELFEKCKNYAYEDGMKRANIGPGHMYTYITALFVCDTCSQEARKVLKKTRIYKSFRFSLHGWMDFHTAVLEVRDNRITTNSSGKCLREILKNVLFKEKRRRRV